MQQYVNDLYAPLAHIPEMSVNTRPRWMQSWVSLHDVRRLAAYNILGSYRSNTRRFHLPKEMWVRPSDGAAPAEQMREYGDAALFVDTARSLLLGDEQTIRLADGAPDAFLTWIEDWAIKERLTQKLLEGEEHAIGDGDAVYVLGWSPAKGRPVVRVMDPASTSPTSTPPGPMSRSSPRRCTSRGSGRTTPPIVCGSAGRRGRSSPSWRRRRAPAVTRARQRAGTGPSTTTHPPSTPPTCTRSTSPPRATAPSCPPAATRRLSHIVAARGWEGAKENPEVRRTLQRLGTEGGRKVLGENIWVDTAMRTAHATDGPVVFTDCRFPNEAHAVRRAGGIVVRIERAGLPNSDSHPSESALDDWPFDYVVHNDGTIADLHEVAEQILSRV